MKLRLEVDKINTVLPGILRTPGLSNDDYARLGYRTITEDDAVLEPSDSRLLPSKRHTTAFCGR